MGQHKDQLEKEENPDCKQQWSDYVAKKALENMRKALRNALQKKGKNEEKTIETGEDFDVDF